MRQSKVNTQKLVEAVDQAVTKIEEAGVLLNPFLSSMSPGERKTTPRPRDGFGPAARQLVREVVKHPKIAAAVELDSASLVMDLDNIDALAPLLTRLDALTSVVADSKLAWLARVQRPSLAAYRVAKVAVKSNPMLQPVVDAIAPMVASHRKRKPKASVTPRVPAPSSGQQILAQ